jgi:hypothetical protein
MAKGIFASAAVLFVAFACTTGNAAGADDDGCEVLTELVRSGVHASATEFAIARPAARIHSSGRRGAVGSTLAGRQACANTAEVTTRAFSEALSALSMPVSWNREPPMDRGDYCLSHDLRQCYPSQYPLYAPLGPNQLAFVYDAWKGVRNAVASQMPFGTARGLSQFTPASLDTALSRNLQSSVDGPLYSSYQGSEADRRRR